MKKIIVLTFSAFFLISSHAMSQDTIFGKWKTIDDETGKPKSIVEIYEKDGKAYGKVVEITDPEKQEAVCDECDKDDPRKNERILGMVVLKDMEKDDDEWDDGTILDPNNGKVYRCKMWLEEGQLQVRGYIGFSLLGRTQTWKPLN